MTPAATFNRRVDTQRAIKERATNSRTRFRHALQKTSRKLTHLFLVTAWVVVRDPSALFGRDERHLSKSSLNL
jgi:hypothetical protein